jgi:phosphate transport system substrate-binding protein
MNVFPFTNIAVLIISALTIIITRAISKKKIIFDKRTLIYAGVFICLLGVSVFQIYDRSTRILNAVASTERVKDEVDVNNYRPFLNGINDRLKRLNKPSSVSFTENYPRLDGATAAYPVYAAMVQELYTGLDETTVREYVTCSRTDEAYLRLIKGEIDILFGAEPSKGQREKARARGRKLVLTPIAKEAFVFFVNKDNPVDSLTLSQIQDIYQKKITNWKTVGGNHEKIMPFQRPENSGSQTIMLSLLMKDKILPAPLEEEKADRMNRIINEVAEYRNYSSAIGYSFRYFATEMNPNDNIKLLTIDGVEPSAANIRNGTYPFTLDVYAVTTDFTADENAEKLIEWILSEQGQDFIELCGYVRR